MFSLAGCQHNYYQLYVDGCLKNTVETREEVEYLATSYRISFFPRKVEIRKVSEAELRRLVQ